MFKQVSKWVVVLGLLVVGILSGYCYRTFVPKESLAYYYSRITAQESVVGSIAITDAEWEHINKCKQTRGALANKRTQDCLRDFYIEYTLTHGVRRSFSHLALLQKESKSFVEDCHYVSHGIGHAQLQVNKGDIGKAFATMSEDAYFKNVSTCGNGYFHGVIEEYSKQTNDKEMLVKILSNVCKEPGLKNAIDCFHGMGHAAFVQLEYATDDALYVCDNVTSDPVKNYSCYMGVFMEMAQDFATRDMVEVKDGRMTFKVCDSVDEKYKVACYGQHSAFFENFNLTPDDFTKNMRYCKQIENDRYRMACVKFIAGRATRAVQYEDVSGMCAETSSPAERVMCTAVVATRIAYSIDRSRGNELYIQALHDICKTLPFYRTYECIDLVSHKSDKIYYDPNVMNGAM